MVAIGALSSMASAQTVETDAPEAMPAEQPDTTAVVEAEASELPSEREESTAAEELAVPPDPEAADSVAEPSGPYEEEASLALEQPPQMPIVVANPELEAAPAAEAKAPEAPPEAPSLGARLEAWFAKRTVFGVGRPSGRAPSGDASRYDEPAGPQPVVSLHGYMRMRGEIMRNFFLSRQPLPGASSDAPFSRFRPAEDGVSPLGGCGSSPTTDPDVAAPCSSRALRFANMRFRIEPTFSLNEYIHLHMTVDALDNLLLGSTPDSTLFVPSDSGLSRAEVTRTPSEVFATSAQPPSAYRNSDRDSLRVKRAYARVGHPDLGELRFGRMPWHWGLGIFANNGNGLDDDFGSDVDRLMGMVHLFGFTFAATYDFAADGIVRYATNDGDFLQLDGAERDDVDQFMVAIARRESPSSRAEKLAAGKVVVNGGLQFVRRKQFLSSTGVIDALDSGETAGVQLVRRDAWEIIPDLWLELAWKNFRFETEAVLSYGRVENLGFNDFSDDDLTMLRFGFAAESELRLLDDKLGIYLDFGYATGDADTDGLSTEENLYAQRSTDRRISTFAFHRNYRIDLILWRNILGHVAGAYYFKPGVSYDFLRDALGQRAGGRFDIIYSRASEEVQTYGSAPDLGVELDFSLYYQGRAGLSVDDGFFAQLQYGVLFPLAGLGYPQNGDIEVFPEGNPGLGIAHAARLLLGVQF